MRKLLILCEEGSAKKFLDIFIPRLVSEYFPNYRKGTDYNFNIIETKGKGNIKKRLAQLDATITNYTHLIILVDQDDDDCCNLKSIIQNSVSWKTPTKIRIACHELESFYLGDKVALKHALGKDVPLQRRKPDNIPNAAKYISQYKNYAKTELAPKMGKLISLQTESYSFNILTRTIKEMLS